MAFDPFNPKHIAKLNTAVEQSKKQFQPRLAKLLNHKAQYVGHDYGHDAAPDSVPINVIELGVNTLQRFVSSKLPRVMVSTPHDSLLAQAYTLEQALNIEADRIDLGEAFNTWVHEALFCWGILVVGIDGDGRISVDSVPTHRFIPDLGVAEWHKQQFIGHEYDMPLDWVKENEAFDPKIREKITAHTADDDNSGDYDHNPDRMQRGRMLWESFEDTITLRHLYLPDYELRLQFVVGQEQLGPIQVLDWDGPPRGGPALGMYHQVSFGKVPGGLIPNAPVAQWAPMHDVINTCWNKLADQAERQKTIGLARGQASADAQRIVPSQDGDVVFSDDPGGFIEQSLGGPNQETFAFVLQAKMLWDWLSGNMSSIGGLAPQSGTLGQDRLLKASSSGRTDDMQDITRKAILHVFKDLAWWMWNDKFSEYHVLKQVENTDMAMPSTWFPWERDGDFTDYNFKIDQYALPSRSPQEEAATFVSDLQLFMAAEPSMQAQAIAIDWEFVGKRLAKLQDMPDLKRMFRYLEGEMHHMPGPIEGGGMPAITQRTHVRENRPMTTPNSSQEALVAHLMGMGQQSAQQGRALGAGAA